MLLLSCLARDPVVVVVVGGGDDDDYDADKTKQKKFAEDAPPLDNPEFCCLAHSLSD